MSLRGKKRLAADILDVGVQRIRIDPERAEDVEMAITRSEIRRLIHEGAIKALPEKSQSSLRARTLAAKKKSGRRSGPGSRKGGRYSIVSRKTRWINRIRALRKRLKSLRDRRTITVSTYRQLYRKAKGGEFRSIAELERYIEEHSLRRRAFG